MDNLALALLLDSGGGGSYRDSIFHDIVDNSDTVATVKIDDTYRFTIGVYEDYKFRFANSWSYITNCSDVEAEGKGYDKGIAVPQRSLYQTRILWEGDTPIYAVYDTVLERLSNDPGVIAVNGNEKKYTYYAYYRSKTDYIKGSAVNVGELEYQPIYNNWIDGVLYLQDRYVAVQGGIPITYQERIRSYAYEQENVTDIPTIIKKSDTFQTVKTTASGNLYVVPYAYNSGFGVFSDMLASQFDTYIDKIKTAICDRFSIPPCYTHKPAVWLKQ